MSFVKPIRQNSDQMTGKEKTVFIFIACRNTFTCSCKWIFILRRFM